MDSQMLRNFFLWCAVVNAVLLLVTFASTVLAGDFLYRMHTRFYPMPRAAFNVAIYGFLGLYKLAIIVFNLAPLAALTIMG